MRLEKLANVAIIGTCIIVAGQVGLGLYRGSSSRSGPPPRAYESGTIIKDSPDLGFQKARKTLLIFTASTCHFCTASMPFYRRLTAAAKKADVRVLATSFESPEANRSYLQSHDVLVDAAASSIRNNLSIHATPTLVLVKQDGKVINSWTGLLSDEQESQVFLAISRSELTSPL